MTGDSDPQWVKDRRSVFDPKAPFSIGASKVRFRGENFDPAHIAEVRILRRAIWIRLVAAIALFIAVWFFIETGIGFLDSLIKGIGTAVSIALLVGLFGPNARSLVRLTLRNGVTHTAFVRWHVAQEFCRVWEDYSQVMSLVDRPSEP